MTETVPEPRTLETQLLASLKVIERKPNTFGRILLEKIVDDGTDVLVGELYSYTYKSLTRDEALRRAAKALARDLKGEDRLHWREVRA